MWVFFGKSYVLYCQRMRPVTVQFLKNPDVIHWGFETFYLGEDDWGHWMAVPKGTVRWKGERGFPPTRQDAVFCAPRDEWWHLHYEGPGAREYQSFIDIISPIRWISENRYEMVDLDLDVALHQDGTIEVQDEDEFEFHQVRYEYTDEMIHGAVAETARIVDALKNRAEPFFEVAQRWLSVL